MDIKRYTPPPVAPPPTYDIKGLTQEELQLLRDVLAHFQMNSPTYDMYKKMDKALEWPDTKHQVYDNNADMGVRGEVHKISALSIRKRD